MTTDERRPKNKRAPVLKKKEQAKVTLEIRSGPAKPAQKSAWRKFWERQIANVRWQLESSHNGPTVVGIDVGGYKKGFHAVAFRDRKFVDKIASRDPMAVVDWCHDRQAKVVAVDAPCRWSGSGS